MPVVSSLVSVLRLGRSRYDPISNGVARRRRRRRRYAVVCVRLRWLCLEVLRAWGGLVLGEGLCCWLACSWMLRCLDNHELAGLGLGLRVLMTSVLVGVVVVVLQEIVALRCVWSGVGDGSEEALRKLWESLREA